MLIAEIIRHKDEIVAVVDGFGSDLGIQEPEDSASAGRVGTERRVKVEKSASVLKAVPKQHGLQRPPGMPAMLPEGYTEKHPAVLVPREPAAVLGPKTEPIAVLKTTPKGKPRRKPDNAQGNDGPSPTEELIKKDPEMWKLHGDSVAKTGSTNAEVKSKCEVGCGRYAAFGWTYCCTSCPKSNGKRHGPACNKFAGIPCWSNKKPKPPDSAEPGDDDQKGRKRQNSDRPPLVLTERADNQREAAKHRRHNTG